jgi:hypothetical protein
MPKETKELLLEQLGKWFYEEVCLFKNLKFQCSKIKFRSEILHRDEHETFCEVCLQ